MVANYSIVRLTSHGLLGEELSDLYLVLRPGGVVTNVIETETDEYGPMIQAGYGGQSNIIDIEVTKDEHERWQAQVGGRGARLSVRELVRRATED